MTEKNENKVNMNNHSKSEFQDVVQQGLREGGIQLTAMKGYGKSRLLFSMANYLQSLPTVKVIIFDGSMAWLYGYNKIPVFTIGEHDIQLADVKTTQDIETYQFNNWQLIKLALNTQKDLLIRLKTKSPSKRGYAIRTIINYLDDLQRAEKEQTATHENSKKIAYFIEEFEDAFNNRSTVRLEAETFLTTFNEGRNFNESFFTCSQRENDCSKTLRVKQLMAYGKIPESDKTPYHRRLEKQVNINLSNMQPRTWLIEGKTIISPDWKQSGKPYQINRALREQYFKSQQPQQPKGLLARFQNYMAKKT